MKGDSFKKIGYKITGAALIRMEEETGWVLMDEYLIPSESMSKEMLLRCVNDAGMGCKEIVGATIDIFDLYKSGRTEFNRKIIIKGTPERRKFFRRGKK